MVFEVCIEFCFGVWDCLICCGLMFGGGYRLCTLGAGGFEFVYFGILDLSLLGLVLVLRCDLCCCGVELLLLLIALVVICL